MLLSGKSINFFKNNYALKIGTKKTTKKVLKMKMSFIFHVFLPFFIKFSWLRENKTEPTFPVFTVMKHTKN